MSRHSKETGLQLVWTQHLKTQEQKEGFAKALLNQADSPILKRLKGILTKRLQELEDKETNREVYNTANWSHLQAHDNGAKMELKTILDILNFIP